MPPDRPRRSSYASVGSYSSFFRRSSASVSSASPSTSSSSSLSSAAPSPPASFNPAVQRPVLTTSEREQPVTRAVDDAEASARVEESLEALYLSAANVGSNSLRSVSIEARLRIQAEIRRIGFTPSLRLWWLERQRADKKRNRLGTEFTSNNLQSSVNPVFVHSAKLTTEPAQHASPTRASTIESCSVFNSSTDEPDYLATSNLPPSTFPPEYPLSLGNTNTIRRYTRDIADSGTSRFLFSNEIERASLEPPTIELPALTLVVADWARRKCVDPTQLTCAYSPASDCITFTTQHLDSLYTIHLPVDSIHTVVLFHSLGQSRSVLLLIRDPFRDDPPNFTRSNSTTPLESESIFDFTPNRVASTSPSFTIELDGTSLIPPLLDKIDKLSPTLSLETKFFVGPFDPLQIRLEDLATKLVLQQPQQQQHSKLDSRMDVQAQAACMRKELRFKIARQKTVLWARQWCT
ncbi:uncharacterized protein JCM15063_005409 [Sporobolomyces koalae]|uniref:uncharacterized protein n=1 Tax=Sporobolomyces koalae TaxID=500713 RepID=UPI0031743D93